MEGNPSGDSSNKEAVWALLGRHSKVGAKLFQLFHGGDTRGHDIGNLFSTKNREAYLRKKASGNLPKSEPKPKRVPKSRAYVEVPAPTPPRPAAPAAAQRTQGKKSHQAIQQETQHFVAPIPEPKRPLLGEAEKLRLATAQEYAGNVPSALRELLWQGIGCIGPQPASGSGGGGEGRTAGAGEGRAARAQLEASFRQLSEEITAKQAAVRVAGSEAEADKLRRHIKEDLKHLKQVEEMLAKLEARA